MEEETLTKRPPMKRTRLSPEVRKDQLLDAAKTSILKGGLQQFSLKQLAVDAGVSEPLLFHYFSSRNELLQQLLYRDFNRTIDALNLQLDKATDLNDILRIYVCHNYDRQTDERIIDILLAEPEIASVAEERRSKNADERGRILINRISKTLGIRRRKAAMIALMASAASISAAKYARDTNMNRDEVIETVIEFLTQGFESQRNKSRDV
jgi:AcrR family transcriptional regulator